MAGDDQQRSGLRAWQIIVLAVAGSVVACALMILPLFFYAWAAQSNYDGSRVVDYRYSERGLGVLFVAMCSQAKADDLEVQLRVTPNTGPDLVFTTRLGSVKEDGHYDLGPMVWDSGGKPVSGRAISLTSVKKATFTVSWGGQGRYTIDYVEWEGDNPWSYGEGEPDIDAVRPGLDCATP